MPELIRHPDFPAPDLTVEAEAVRQGRGLRLRYVLRGALGRVLVPAPREPERADELWRHTCLEAFVGLPDGGYYEFNFAPSLSWASYHFDGYRQGMCNATVEPWEIQVERPGGALELSAIVDVPDDGPWRVGLTTVVEDIEGARSWWALQHPPGKPDFHNADCFALELPGSRGA